MKREYLTTSPLQTKKIGKNLAKSLLKRSSSKRTLVLGLVGDLGGGKTTFLQGFAKGLGIKKRILSPTFIIIRRIKNFYHVDCYRIQKPKELLSLGFEEIINKPSNIVAVEWADKVKSILPNHTVWFSFSFVDKNKRKIVLKLKDGR
ncbi:hypothetical protein AMJ47_03830 [Parcubacteria bacterium DG_72]|nr:MAG: hypothetical protein AMJ47_03830 [Parcubacteria bacterium DG_72]